MMSLRESELAQSGHIERPLVGSHALYVEKGSQRLVDRQVLVWLGLVGAGISAGFLLGVGAGVAIGAVLEFNRAVIGESAVLGLQVGFFGSLVIANRIVKGMEQ